MAEYVFQNVEGMLPELEEMERLQLFTKDEIKCIVKRRTAFEYKLQRRVAREADYLRYIQYELNLDLLRKMRKKKCAIQQKHFPGEAVFIKRMHFLFQSAVKKFPCDTKLWLQYVEYCKKAGSTHILGNVVGRMLQAHPNNSALWIMAAKWEFEDGHNVKSARTLMQRALRLNPKSCDLWLEYFRLELLFLDKVKKRRKLLRIEENTEAEDVTNSSDFLSGKTSQIVYRNAIKNISDNVTFRLKFIDIYHLFNGCEEGIEEVYNSLSNDFPHSEEAWNALAWRKINELHAGKIQCSQPSNLEAVRNRIFEKAVVQVNSEKMWGYYIEACVGDLERCSDNVVKKKVDQVMKVFQSAHKERKLSIEKYLLWINTCQRNGEWKEALKVCKTSLEVFPVSLLLWKQYFTLQSLDVSIVHGIDEFCSSLKRLQSEHDILEMWYYFLEFYGTQKTLDGIDRVYECSISVCNDNKVIWKIHESYLEFFLLRDDIKSARKIYKRLLKETSVSFLFYKKCISLETSQVEVNLKQSRKLYETAVNRFGSTSPDLWIDYIKFEQKEGDSTLVTRLHWRAMKSLAVDNVEQFVSKYTLAQQHFIS